MGSLCSTAACTRHVQGLWKLTLRDRGPESLLLFSVAVALWATRHEQDHAALNAMAEGAGLGEVFQ